MRYFPTDRPGYVYCVRRLGKTYYHLGSAPAGELCDRVQQLTELEKNPKAIVLLGWVEVSDHVAAEQHLKEVFHLYKMEDDWFDFRASRAADLKSLLETYADLAQKFPWHERLIDAEVKPDYDRSFGFFEFLQQFSAKSYHPDPSAAENVVKPIARDRRSGLSGWMYGAAVTTVVAIGGLMVANGFTAQFALNFLSTPTPTSTPTPFTPSQSVNPEPPVPPSAKPSVKSPGQPHAPGFKTVVLSPTTDGAIFRSAPSASSVPIDYLINGTPVTFGSLSGEWQEVILANGQRGWVSNSLLKE